MIILNNDKASNTKSILRYKTEKKTNISISANTTTIIYFTELAAISGWERVACCLLEMEGTANTAITQYRFLFESNSTTVGLKNNSIVTASLSITCRVLYVNSENLING